MEGRKKWLMNTFLSKRTTPIKIQINQYLEWCEFVKMMTRSTMITKRKALDRFVAVNPGLKDLTKLTNNQFDSWRASLAREGKAGKTINNYADHIIGAVRYLKDRKELQVAINLHMIDRAEENACEARYFTSNEIAQIKDHCSGLRELLLISLLYDTGLRISEVSALKVESFSNLAVVVKKGKNRKDRLTFMLTPTKEMLDKWLLLNDITTGYIFPSPTKFDNPLSVCQIRDSINAPIRAAGFKEGSAHTIRHSFITRLVDGGADIFTTQTLAGHSDPKTTRHYYHTNRERLAKKHAEAMA